VSFSRYQRYYVSVGFISVYCLRSSVRGCLVKHASRRAGGFLFRPRMRQGLAVVVAPISRLGMNTRRRKLHCRYQFTTPTRTSPERAQDKGRSHLRDLCGVEHTNRTSGSALFQRRLLRKRREFHRGIRLSFRSQTCSSPAWSVASPADQPSTYHVAPTYPSGPETSCGP
jgi:hypothetical protein